MTNRQNIRPMIVRLAILIALILLLAACGSDASQRVANDVQILMDVHPDPPATGDSTLVFTVLNADGSAIDGATVFVHGDMDHEGMLPVEGETSDSEAGVYHVPFVWTMGGGWLLDVTVTLPDNQGIATEHFELFVGAISTDSVINRASEEMNHDEMGEMSDEAMDSEEMNHDEMGEMSDEAMDSEEMNHDEMGD